MCSPAENRTAFFKHCMSACKENQQRVWGKRLVNHEIGTCHADMFLHMCVSVCVVENITKVGNTVQVGFIVCNIWGIPKMVVPKNGWFISWKIPSRNGWFFWWYPHFRNPPYLPICTVETHGFSQVPAPCLCPTLPPAVPYWATPKPCQSPHWLPGRSQNHLHFLNTSNVVKTIP